MLGQVSLKCYDFTKVGCSLNHLVLQARCDRTARWDVSLGLDGAVSHEHFRDFNRLEEDTHPVGSITLVRVEQDARVGSLVCSWEVEVACGDVATTTSDRDLDTNWRSKAVSKPVYRLSLANLAYQGRTGHQRVGWLRATLGSHDE